MDFSLVTFCVSGSITQSVASIGCRDNNLDNASDVFPFAMCSSQRPKDTNTNNIGGVSKKVFGLFGNFSSIAITSTATCKDGYK